MHIYIHTFKQAYIYIITQTEETATFTKLKLTTFLVYVINCFIGKHELILSLIDYSLSRGKCFDSISEKNHECINTFVIKYCTNMFYIIQIKSQDII